MFGKNTKVDLELNREVEQLLKTGGKERILPIVQAGEPVLRQQTVQYSGQLSKGTLNKLIDTMHTTMLEAPGVGLAATQTRTIRAKSPNSRSTSSSTPVMSRSATRPAASTKAA